MISPKHMTTTTIKVPIQLRERVQEHARRERVSQASVLSHAMDLLDREAFFTQLRKDTRASPEDRTEQAEREAWLAGPISDADE